MPSDSVDMQYRKNNRLSSCSRVTYYNGEIIIIMSDCVLFGEEFSEDDN